MLVKDKDILVDGDNNNANPIENTKKVKIQRPKISGKNMRSAWGDAFDYYLRGITEKYLLFRGRASRLEFWGFSVAATIIWIPLYFGAQYIDMPLLPYYYILATLIPTVALASRRLHDQNKSAPLFLLPIPFLAASGFFIGLYPAALLVLLWAVFLINIFSRSNNPEQNIYGDPTVNDEIYGDESILIIKKFRAIALILFFVWIAVSAAKLDDWSRQAQQKATISSIMDKVLIEGKEANLSPQQIDEAQKQMMNVLKSLSGQTVSPDDLAKNISDTIKAVSTPASSQN